MDYKAMYEYWLSSDVVDSDTKARLREIQDNDATIFERFHRFLEFGTAGMRGIMTDGTNAMNIYTVRHVTEALARYVDSTDTDGSLHKRGACIGYDCRYNSRLFAEAAAAVLAAHGVKVYLFEDLRPTPEVSFAIRHTNATTGIVITASHNPKAYNGYKVYWDDGGQLPPHVSDVVLKELPNVDIFAPKTMPFADAVESGLIEYIGKEVDEAYLAAVMTQRVYPDLPKQYPDFPIVYTPFHGTGITCVPEVLKRSGYGNIIIVPEQEKPDGGFPTVVSPNPEDKEGFAIPIALAKQHNAELIIATDPDADRTGIAVRADGEYVLMTGNQVGALLTHYVCSQRKANGTLPTNGAVISTIVSTQLTRAIVESFGLTYVEVLTGFKFFGEQIKGFEQTGSHAYVFGFEESYGYLAGTHARDKDAIVTSMLIAEMTLWHHSQGRTLPQAMQSLYDAYGYYKESNINLFYEGVEGPAQMKAAMQRVRAVKDESALGGMSIVAVRDYLSRERVEGGTGAVTPLELPVSDVVYIELEGGTSVVVRPSGTEPKIKVYLLIKSDDATSASATEQALRDAAKALLGA